jgi:hypothetical protein
VTGAHAEADVAVDISVTAGGKPVAASTVRAAEDGTFAWSIPVQVQPGVEIAVSATMDDGTVEAITATATYLPPATTTTTSTTSTTTTTPVPPAQEPPGPVPLRPPDSPASETTSTCFE